MTCASLYLLFSSLPGILQAHITAEDYETILTLNHDHRKLSVGTMSETENQGTRFSLDSPISKDDNPASKPGYSQIPPAMFDEIRRVFWDRGKSLIDIDHWSSRHPQYVIDHLQQLIVRAFLTCIILILTIFLGCRVDGGRSRLLAQALYKVDAGPGENAWHPSHILLLLGR